MKITLQIQLVAKKGLMILSLFLLATTVKAQTVIYSSDSLVKVSSVLSDDILLNESIADSLTIEVNGEGGLYFSKLSANDFVLKYKQSTKVLDQLRFESEPYCEVVPNCDKILRLPFIKAIHQLDASRYALIGYVRAKSPVFIIRHIWILDVSNKPKISKRILYLGNKQTISFTYNLSKNELVLYQQFPMQNGITENGVFIMDSNGVLTSQGIASEAFDRDQFYKFLKAAKEHPQVGLGVGIYEIPSGNKFDRIPKPVNEDQPIYRIKLD